MLPNQRHQVHEHEYYERKIITIFSAAVLRAFFFANLAAKASGNCPITNTGGQVVVQSGVLCPTTSLSNCAWAAER